MPDKIDERFVSASLDGTARPIFPMGLARPNAASSRKALPSRKRTLSLAERPRKAGGRVLELKKAGGGEGGETEEGGLPDADKDDGSDEDE